MGLLPPRGEPRDRNVAATASSRRCASDSAPRLAGVDVVFVVGLAIEVAGAALLAAGQIRLVDRTTATREPGAPRREAHQESARFTVGFALLAAGVIVQLVGYAVDGGWWLLGLAIGVIVLAAAVGRVIADAPVTSWLHRQAVEYWENEQASPD